MLGGALRFAVPALLAALFGPGLLGDNCAAFFWLTTGFAAAFVLLFVGVTVVEGVKSPATLSRQFAFRPRRCCSLMSCALLVKRWCPWTQVSESDGQAYSITYTGCITGAPSREDGPEVDVR